MKRLILAWALGMMLLVSGTPAGAVTDLGNLVEGHYNQQDSPCFLGYSCGPNMGIPMTTWSGSVPAEGTDSSPVYTGTDLANLIGLVGTTPLIAIDINQSGRVGSDDSYYEINKIEVFFNGSGTAAYQFGPNNSPLAVPQTVTGNGNSDWVIPGLILPPDLTSLQLTVTWGNPSGTIGDNNDGKDLYFLVRSGTTQVPEPTALLLLGLSLFGVAAAGRKFKKEVLQ